MVKPGKKQPRGTTARCWRLSEWLCSRAQLPCTPEVADSGRAAVYAALSFQRIDLHLTEFQWSTRSCGPRRHAQPSSGARCCL